MQTVDFKKLGLQAGDTVLDLGCGEGRHVISAYIEANVHSFGVDLGFADLQTTRDKSQAFLQPDDTGRSFGLAQANALRLPFADNTFDKIVCSEVLEHIADYHAVLVEIERVLKPGGDFVASVPRFWPEWLCWAFSDAYHANEGGHLRIFKAGQLRAQIEQLGFAYRYQHWAHALHAPFWWLKCLVWNTQEQSRLVKIYHRFLVWDLMDRPWLTRTLEKFLNPLMGKSVVLYFRLPQ